MPITKGFTLIEVLMAVGIFASLLLITNGVFTRFVVTQRRDISEQDFQEDLRLAIEIFAREARTAYASSFAVLPAEETKDIGPALIFRNQNGLCVMHRRQGTSWHRAEKQSNRECDQITYEETNSLTSKETKITQLDFKIPTNILKGGQLNRQGFITLMIEASSKNTSVPSLQLQTTLTSRQIKAYGQ